MFKGFILASYPIKEQDLRLDVFSCEQGRRSLLLSARQAKKVSVHLFCQYQLSWIDDKSRITWFEPETPYLLEHQALYCGHYLNELLAKLLPMHESYDSLYACYQQCLQALSEQQAPQPWLRLFETRLLDELGYGFVYHQDASGHAINKDAYYEFEPKVGFKLSNYRESTFLGASLLGWHEGEEIKNADWLMAKKVLGSMIDALLDTPLISRELIEASMKGSAS